MVPEPENGRQTPNDMCPGTINGGLYCCCAFNFTTYLEQFSFFASALNCRHLKTLQKCLLILWINTQKRRESGDRHTHGFNRRRMIINFYSFRLFIFLTRSPTCVSLCVCVCGVSFSFQFSSRFFSFSLRHSCLPSKTTRCVRMYSKS